MFKSVALLTLLLSAAIAVPTPTENLLPRACTTRAPSVIDILKDTTPNTASIGQYFNLERTSSPLKNTKLSALTFNNIPAGATGCRLEVAFPPLGPNSIATGDVQAEFWSTDPWNVNTAPTFNNPPRKREMVGTYRFPTAANDQSTHTVIASNTCSETMSWLAYLSDWQQNAGSVAFNNRLDIQNMGFSLVFNC
ncbi:hypothetical protein BDV29DRAFT_195757 [Aspergillus leporis]|uniref:Ubiquitin 3 binding protein But2 C-terminal domain-containing protein n=1 Tax=Aspergillus leporis TaxID=41062 RepID=A0A5N5WLY3_9EURO|nr:hypothetical protein BDV29DRAFT_195757 [Aspergillus leporis]